MSSTYILNFISQSTTPPRKQGRSVCMLKYSLSFISQLYCFLSCDFLLSIFYFSIVSLAVSIVLLFEFIKFLILTYTF